MDCHGLTQQPLDILVRLVIGDERVSVLVADHNRWTRLNVAAALDAAGLSVTEASNGVSAMRTALDLALHIVIIGPELPEIGAVELAEGLRSDPRTRHIAIVGLHNEVDADAALELPCNPIDLLAAVADALETRRHVLAAAPIRSVMASPRGTWPLVEGTSSRSTSRTRNAGRSGKVRLRSGIDTL